MSMKKTQTTEIDELHIEHPELEQRMCEDLKNYGILYFHAPIGWEKDRLVLDFAAHHPELDACIVTDPDQIPETKGGVRIVPGLERLLEQPGLERLWTRVGKEDGRNDGFSPPRRRFRRN